jgi:hypothetical protein
VSLVFVVEVMPLALTARSFAAGNVPGRWISGVVRSERRTLQAVFSISEIPYFSVELDPVWNRLRAQFADAHPSSLCRIWLHR